MFTKSRVETTNWLWVAFVEKSLNFETENKDMLAGVLRPLPGPVALSALFAPIVAFSFHRVPSAPPAVLWKLLLRSFLTPATVAAHRMGRAYSFHYPSASAMVTEPSTKSAQNIPSQPCRGPNAPLFPLQRRVSSHIPRVRDRRDERSLPRQDPVSARLFSPVPRSPIRRGPCP